MFMFSTKTRMPSPGEALSGRNEAMPVMNRHYVNGHPIKPPFPENMATAMFGMGCFWGVERKYWQVEGVYTTAVGYAGGYTANPVYQEVCTGKTGHNEVVYVIYDPALISYEQLLKMFWEGHDRRRVCARAMIPAHNTGPLFIPVPGNNRLWPKHPVTSTRRH